MLDRYLLNNALFVRLTTAAVAPRFEDLSPAWQAAWQRRIVGNAPKPAEIARVEAEMRYRHAARVPEFGRVVAITVGKFVSSKEPGAPVTFATRTMVAASEAQLLTDFASVLDRHLGSRQDRYIVGFCLKEFVVSFLVRRYLISGLPIPPAIEVFGRKPWDLEHLLDLQDVWKAGDRDSLPSLPLVALALNVPCTDADSGEAGDPLKAFLEAGDGERLSEWAQDYVVTLARVYLRLSGGPDLPDDAIKKQLLPKPKVEDHPAQPLGEPMRAAA